MPDAFSTGPVNEPHVAEINLFLTLHGTRNIQPVAEGRIEHQSGEKDLIAGACMAENLFKPFSLADDIAGKFIGYAEPLGAEIEIHITIDPISDCHLQTFENMIDDSCSESSLSFRKNCVISESCQSGFLELPEIDKLLSFVGIEKRMYLILCLDRQIHP